MRILHINKFFHIIGGTDTYFFEVIKLLKKYRHFVAEFSTNSSSNRNSKWKFFFIEEINPLLIQNVYKVIYSISAKQKIKNLLPFFNPTIVHLHSIYHHITPSILPEIASRNIPIVQTISDYHLISPNYSMYHNGKICEVTKQNRFFKSIFHKCVKNSYLASCVETIEKYFYFWLGWDKDLVDYFIAPSIYTKTKLEEYGINKKKVVHIPHFINSKYYESSYEKCNYILYFGRLSSEKGLEMLLDVASKLLYIPFKIVGKGPIKGLLIRKTRSLRLDNVEFIDFQNKSKLKGIIGKSTLTILPSLWYEVFGISILESFASGKPVVASRIGGIPEIVKDGYNGFLFEPGNVDDCVVKINKLWNDTALCKKMGKNARNYVEKHFSPQDHYERLMALYKKAISKYR